MDSLASTGPTVEARIKVGVGHWNIEEDEPTKNFCRKKYRVKWAGNLILNVSAEIVNFLKAVSKAK